MTKPKRRNENEESVEENRSQLAAAKCINEEKYRKQLTKESWRLIESSS